MRYQDLCAKTESISPKQGERIAYEVRLLHGAIGLATESGEILDNLKKYIYYGANLDKPNLQEELGDVLWYIALLCNELNVDMQEVMDKNIEKLKRRYGEKFSEECATSRNLKYEQQVFQYDEQKTEEG